VRLAFSANVVEHRKWRNSSGELANHGIDEPAIDPCHGCWNWHAVSSHTRPERHKIKFEAGSQNFHQEMITAPPGMLQMRKGSSSRNKRSISGVSISRWALLETLSGKLECCDNQPI
jgi:hypothetical protein